LANLDVANQRSAAWRAAHPERQRASEKAYRTANPDKRKQACAAYRSANSEKEKAYAKKWREDNKPHLAAKSAARRALRQNATPPWVDFEAIQEVYDFAAVMSADTGEPWHVDHIHPLKHELICGLHWAGNLQVLPASTNLSKNNRIKASEFEPRRLTDASRAGN
jgi:hypothetical protein